MKQQGFSSYRGIPAHEYSYADLSTEEQPSRVFTLHLYIHLHRALLG
jgi:hypothetical protein